MEYCIGVDLGGTNIAVGIVDLKAKTIVRKSSIKTNAPRSLEEISKDILRIIQNLVKSEGLALSDMKWVGIATPGIVKGGVVVSASNLGWENADFAGIMRGLTGLPVFVANDANCAAYAEALWGAGENAHSLIIITLGTGIGGGIVIDGKIWEGKNGFAAEIGHMIIDTDGRNCACGKRGCFEAYSSARALVLESRRMMSLYKDSLMWTLAGGDLMRVSGVIPFKAAAANDVAAQAVIDDYVKYLAVGVSNVINIFQPDVVCIGGGVSGEGDNLMIPLREKIERISFGTAKSKTKVCVAKYMNDAGIIGSALLGKQEENSKMKNRIARVIDNFNVDGELISAERYGSGHINMTYKVVMRHRGEDKEYILQRINKNVFKDPAALMENYVNVTEFLRDIIIKNGGDPDRETINAIKTKSGENFTIDDEGEYWRFILFVVDSSSFDKVETPEQFYDSAVAFGNFQSLLRDYPAETLHETIVNFHNTPVRFNNLMNAVKEDKCARLASVMAEVDFCKEREEFSGTLERAREAGKLPLRVTHNDTKLNNILFDAPTGKPICVIDLDTIMPGYSVNDFGDSIRFGATTALEDEADLTKVNFDISLYEMYVKGFIEGANGGLCDAELELLPIGAIMMTLECGMRFLTDYLEGDTYFRTSREGQNLDRARNQFKLVSDMEKKLPEMLEIVKKYSHN